MPVATLNGTDLFYVTEGVGVPCIVLHGGLGLDHSYFRPALTPLGDVLHLVYSDLRGHGRSGRPPIETLTFDQLAEDIDALRAHLGFSRVALLGHSYGGFIALEYALRHPERLSHLILVDTAPATDYPDELAANIKRKASPELAKALQNAAPPTTNVEFEERLHQRAPLYYYRFDPDVAARLNANLILNVAAAQRGTELLRAAYNVVDRLPAITTPSLVLAGRDDFICPPSQAERIARGLPNAECVIFEESGHFPFVEEPSAFFATVHDWLRRNPSV